MPPKIRELIAKLEKAGFTNRGGENHRNYVHRSVAKPVPTSGKPGDDAKIYLIKAAKRTKEYGVRVSVH